MACRGKISYSSKQQVMIANCIQFQDAYWSAKCGKTFTDPPPGTKNTPPTQPSPPTAEPPKAPTKALSIVVEIPPFYSAKNPQVAWLFFTTDYGKAVDCSANAALVEKRNEDTSKASTYPGGTFNIKLYNEDCQYKNDGTNPGRLFCGEKQIDCINDPSHQDGAAIGTGTYMCGPGHRQGMFTCAW